MPDHRGVAEGVLRSEETEDRKVRGENRVLGRSGRGFRKENKCPGGVPEMENWPLEKRKRKDRKRDRNRKTERTENRKQRERRVGETQFGEHIIGNGRQVEAGAYPLEPKVDHLSEKEKRKEWKEQTICFVSEETPGLISGSAALVAQAEGAPTGVFGNP
jgi:hypothetical protein